MSENKLKKIGKYDVLDILGRGGMGVIYKAIDPAIGRMVAIKMITGAFSEDPDLLKRFYREAQSTGTLQHPNVVTVYELGDLDNTPYLVMEYLDGEGLDKYIAEKRPMPLVEKLAMAVQICHGLAYAHQQNVVHRDIKPANVMVLRNGNIKIVDFGIARIGNDRFTKPGQVVGSIHYMSPEQINAMEVDSRTDVFSCGVLIYELITYTLPFLGTDTLTTLMKILNSEAAPLDTLVSGLPPELNGIVQQALAKDRDLRYSSVDDLGFDLNRVLDRLKEEIIAGYLATAEAHIKASEWGKAKDQIALIFRIDRQNTKANMLNREVTAAILRQQLQSQIQEHRAHAEQAVAQHRYDDALASLDQALSLRKTDPTIVRFRDSVEAARQKALRLSDALRRANGAHDAGDLEDAMGALEEALSVEPESPEAKALQAVITRELAERERQKQIDGFQEQARKQMAARQFTSAIEILKKAEELDPTGVKIHELIHLANNAREQEQRRKHLEQLGHEIEDALNHDDYKLACAKAEEALKSFPGDRGLLKLKNLAEKQRELGERRIFVESQIKATRQLLDQKNGKEAQALLEKALQKYPGDPAMNSQLALVKDILAREREEERKSQYIQKAKEFLRQRNFEEAINTLETAQHELKSSEIDDLLHFTREEAAAAEHQKKVEEISEEAQRLVAAEEFEKAVAFLEKSVAELPDEDLQLRLTDTRHAAQEFDRHVKETIAAGDRLIKGRKTAEALKFLEGQPASFTKKADFRAALERAHEEHAKVLAFNEAKENVRAAVDMGDFAAALATIEAAKTKCRDAEELASLREEVESIRQTAANSEIERAVHDARLVLLVRSYDAALKVLQDSSTLLAFASTEWRTQFEALKKDAEESLERQEREAKQRNTITNIAEQLSTRVVGSSNTSIDETHWSSAATATPIPQELTRLEAGIIRERDLMKLQEIAKKCGSAPPGDWDMLKRQTESLGEMYSGDDEFQLLVREALQRLTVLQKVAEQKAVEQREAERKAAEKKEAERKAAEQKAAEQRAAEQRAAEQRAAEQREAERKAAEKKEAEQKAAEQKAAEQRAAEQRAAEQKAAEQRAAEQRAAEQRAAEQKEAERKAAEKKEAEQKAAEQKAAEQRAAEQRAAEQKEAERKATEKREAERKVAEQKAAEQRAAEQKEAERKAAEKKEAERKAAEQKAAEKKVAEKKEAERKAADKKEAERKAAEQKAAEQRAAEQKAAEKKAAEKKEAERKAAEQRAAEQRAKKTAAPATAAVVASPATPSRSRNIVVIGGIAAVFVVAVLYFVLKGPSSSTTTNPSANLIAVRINSSPAGATIRVDGQTCTDPNCELKLAPGKYDVEAMIPGRPMVHQTLVVEAGQKNAAVAMNLPPPPVNTAPPQQAATTASVPTEVQPAPAKRTVLEIVGAPPLTALQVDGKVVGRVGNDGGFSMEVKPGAHTVEFNREGYKPLVVHEKVAADHTARIGPKGLTFAPLPIQLAQKHPSGEQTAPTIAANTPPVALPIPTAAAPVPAPPDPAVTEWDKISATRDQNVLADFRRKFPNSPQAAEAGKRLDQLRAEAAKATPPADSGNADLANARSAIQQLISRYAQAYTSRDASAVSAVWPSLGKQELKKIQDSFKAARSVQMNLRPVREPDVNGDRATIVCSRSLQYVFPQGEPKPLQDTVTIQLRKQNGLWVIDKVE